MQRLPIAVIGASGYSGMEATRILAHHPSAEVRLVTSDRWQGETIERRTGVGGPVGKLRYAPQERVVDLAGECAAALLCTPAAAGAEIDLTFTPHLLPLRRGILATSYLRLAPGVSAKDVTGCFVHEYAAEPFVRLAGSADEVSLKSVVGTNLCQIGFAVKGNRLVVISALDNLVKGAAGQAVQNLNLLFGWPETAGLDVLRGSHP